jgi:hypothetical protein
MNGATGRAQVGTPKDENDVAISPVGPTEKADFRKEKSKYYKQDRGVIARPAQTSTSK